MIEIVTHCYSPERLPHYAKLLELHLVTLFDWPSAFPDLTVTVFYSRSDVQTSNIVNRWAFHFSGRCGYRSGRCGYRTTAKYRGRSFRDRALLLPELGRRAIGRNLAAMETKADVVLFTDVDYMWTPVALRTISKLSFESKTLYYPKQIQVSASHEEGDAVTKSGQWATGSYVPQCFNRAIGGCQIVDGDFARAHGYLNGTDWIRPTETPFANFRDDVAFRRSCGRIGKGSEGVDIPGVFRIRHSTTSYK